MKPSAAYPGFESAYLSDENDITAAAGNSATVIATCVITIAVQPFPSRRPAPRVAKL
jgi:hypothetical protein